MAIINKPSDYFNTKLYTGTGSSNAITGVGFQPDWVWIKSRSDALSHALFDVIRGTTKVLNSNATTAEYTNADTLTAFGTDGFTVGSNTGVNANGETRVAWNWKAGTSFTNDASATGIGSIDSSGSVNTDAGFAIITYTGTGSAETIAHGLGATPSFIISRRIDGADSWMNWNKSFSATEYLFINGNGGSYSASTVFGTLPTSTVYSTGGGTATGANGGNFISYIFVEKQGYSKFSSYKGNGSTDGTFIYTGFKPAWVMFKRTSGGTSNWTMLDTKRSPHNLMINEIYANHPNAESQNGRDIDCLSNGIKIRSSSAEINGSGDNYTFYAFAENPFVTSTGVPATAR